MTLKIIGGTIFGIIVIVSIVVAFKFWSKDQKSIQNIVVVLSELVKDAEEKFKNVNLVCQNFVDNKVYVWTDVEKIKYQHVLGIKSQYSTFAITVEQVNEDGLGVVPFLVSNKTYSNIYIFMKEFWAYYQDYNNVKKYNDDFCNSFNFLIEYMNECGLGINDLYFGPIEDEKVESAWNYALQYGFNLKKDPKDFAKFSKLGKDVGLIELNKYHQLEEKETFEKLLKEIQNANMTELSKKIDFLDSEKMYVLSFGKFEEKFLLNLQILQSELIKDLLGNETNLQALEKILHNFDMEALSANRYQLMTASIFYMIEHHLTIQDISLLEIDEKLIKKMIKNRILMNRILNV